MTTCGWMDVFREEWGMACSEPELGVPTFHEIACREAATVAFLLHDNFWPNEDTTLLLCDRHAQRTRENVLSPEATLLGLSIVSKTSLATS